MSGPNESEASVRKHICEWVACVRRRSAMSNRLCRGLAEPPRRRERVNSRSSSSTSCKATRQAPLSNYHTRRKYNDAARVPTVRGAMGLGCSRPLKYLLLESLEAEGSDRRERRGTLVRGRPPHPSPVTIGAKSRASPVSAPGVCPADRRLKIPMARAFTGGPDETCA